MAKRTERECGADALAADVATRFLPQLRLFALRRLRSVAAAEDAAQETLHRILVALRDGRVRDAQALPAYVFETARHVCAHHVRDEQRTERARAGLADVGRAAAATCDPLSALISAERVRELRVVLAEFADQDRELLRLTYAEGLSADAIGVRLGLTAANVRVRRHRLQKELARRLVVTQSSVRAPQGEAE